MARISRQTAMMCTGCVLMSYGSAFLSAILVILATCCASIAQHAEPVKREILALYDGASEGSADGSRIHRFAELPLNHLGYIVHFHDIRNTLPEPASVMRYRGVLTWFAGGVPDTNAYLAWANDVARRNVQYVILGDIGVDATPRNLFLLNNLLRNIGLQHLGDTVAPTRGVKIAHKDPQLVEFECHLDPVLPDYPVIEPIDSKLRIGLSVEIFSRARSVSSTLVSTSPRGGFAALNYEFCHQKAPTHQGRWLINPFEFFTDAFGREAFPIPDITTISGRRLYFGQMQSQGWMAESQIERYRQTKTVAAEVVLRELVEPFPSLPMTLDLRDSDLQRPGNLQHREPGLHATSVAIKDALLAKPQVDRPGLLALGTKLSRYDLAYPSIANLSATVSPGPSLVFYTPTGDETSYAEDARLQPSDISRLGETLRYTETPRRLKGVNINFHAYAGLHSSTLRAVKTLLQDAATMRLTPVTAGHYARVAQGFFTSRIMALGPLRWQINDRGTLNTVRFERSSELELDLEASSGVLGESRHRNALYIALDESSAEPTIVLRTVGKRAGAAVEGEQWMLSDSNWRVRRLVSSTCYVSFEAQGFGDGEFSWRLAAPIKRRIRVIRGGSDIWQGHAIADADGRLHFKLPVQAIEPVLVEVRCEDERG
jgi:hypothetical protein